MLMTLVLVVNLAWLVFDRSGGAHSDEAGDNKALGFILGGVGFYVLDIFGSVAWRL